MERADWIVEPTDPTWQPPDGALTCFTCSYSWAHMSQVIDLLAPPADSDHVLRRPGLQLTRALLDTAPPIEVGEWYCSRTDCNGHFKFWARLYNEQRRLIAEFQSGEQVGHAGVWVRVQHTFNNYGSGVRYVEIEHAGKSQVNRYAFIHLHCTDDNRYSALYSTALLGRSLRPESHSCLCAGASTTGKSLNGFSHHIVQLSHLVSQLCRQCRGYGPFV